MKKLDQYMLRELSVPFLIGTVAVVLMFQANLVIYILKTFPAAHLPPLALLQIVLYQTPSFLFQTLPVGTALATSLGLSRLARESEITAMRAAGTPLMRIIIPAIAFGISIACLNFYVAEKVVPSAEKQGRKLQQEAAILGAAPEYKSRVTVNLDQYTANIGLVTRDANGDLELSRIMLFERPQVDTVWLWLADSGTYKKGIWTLKDTQLWILKKGSLSDWKPKQDVIINEPIQINDILSEPAPETQSIAQLRATIAEARRLERDTTSMEVAYHTKFSVPAACIVFAITGPAFAIWLSNRGGFVGVFLSVVMVMLYFNVYIISTQVFAANHWVSPMVAAWLPNVVFAFTGLFALRRLE